MIWIRDIHARVEIEPGNWSRSGRITLVVTGNRSGYPTRNPPETSRWFGYLPNPALFWLLIRGVLSSIKISINSQLDSPLYSSSMFQTLLCFLARIHFRSRIRSSSSIILILKTRIRSTYKNEKWFKQKNSRCRNYRLCYHR